MLLRTGPDNNASIVETANLAGAEYIKAEGAESALTLSWASGCHTNTVYTGEQADDLWNQMKVLADGNRRSLMSEQS